MLKGSFAKKEKVSGEEKKKDLKRDMVFDQEVFVQLVAPIIIMKYL